VDPDSLLLTSDVARLCQVSGETVRQWEKAGRLRAQRTISGVRLFRGHEVERLQQQREAAAATRAGSSQ
jgi:DNA-binding transcriptional MerR regulator